MASAASAQNYEKNIFSVRGGMNIANLSASGNGLHISTDSRVAYHIGVTDQILLCDRLPLYLEPGIFLTSRGGKFGSDEESITFRPLYLQVPVVINYHINIKDKVSIEPFAGVYYAFGIAGKAKAKMDGDSEKVNVFGDEGGLKRSDFGVRLGVGAVFGKHYYAGIGYEIGCLNIAKDSDSEAKLHANCWTISVGYKF